MKWVGELWNEIMFALSIELFKPENNWIDSRLEVGFK